MTGDFEAKIPFLDDALLPFFSEETLKYHYHKHHTGYASTLNSLVCNTDFANMKFVDVIKSSRNINQQIFNNASQIYNHNFYWNCLTAKQTSPTGRLKQLIEKQFTSFEIFLNQYIVSATALFGSGWSWLVEEDNVLSFFNTSNAENPIGSNKNPICVIDLWEHAYYIDYKNDRKEYINTVINNCINWDFCSSILD